MGGYEAHRSYDQKYVNIFMLTGRILQEARARHNEDNIVSVSFNALRLQKRFLQ